VVGKHLQVPNKKVLEAEPRIKKEVLGLLKNYPCTAVYKASVSLWRIGYDEDRDKNPLTVCVTVVYYGGSSMTDFLLVYDAIQKHMDTYDMGFEVRLEVHYVRHGLVPPVEDIFEGINASSNGQQAEEIRGSEEQATGEQATGEQAAEQQDAGKKDTVEQDAGEKDARQQDIVEHAAGEKDAGKQDGFVASV